MTDMRGYAVMTYARSGATYFSQLVGSTGCLGRPEDWFNGKGYRDRGVTDYPLDREGQIAKILSEGRTPNGIFGVKLSPVRCDALRGFDWAGRLGPLSFIHLVRDDRLAQAISDARAQQTGQYRSTTAARRLARYDGRQILHSLNNQLLDEARVRRYFAVNAIKPLEFSYEQLIADNNVVLHRIAQFLDVSALPVADNSHITLAVQRDAINEEWRERFLSEYGDLRRIPEVQQFSLSRRLFGRTI